MDTDDHKAESPTAEKGTNLILLPTVYPGISFSVEQRHIGYYLDANQNPWFNQEVLLKNFFPDEANLVALAEELGITGDPRKAQEEYELARQHYHTIKNHKRQAEAMKFTMQSVKDDIADTKATVAQVKDDIADTKATVAQVKNGIEAQANSQRAKRPQITQEDAANMCGVTKKTIQNWESGATNAPKWYPGRNVTAIELKLRVQEAGLQARVIKADRENFKNARKYNEDEDQSDE